jgi:GNAT superfamily N-acetyltransferase
MSGPAARGSRGRRGELAVTMAAVAGQLTAEQREFLRRGWELADRELFGGEVDWSSVPLTVQARAGRALVGLAAGEVIAGMARLHDLLVVQERRGQGVGGRLVREFCARAVALGAGRCFLRCPATERHRRFYERLGFRQVARVPRYYHGTDFLEYMREPLP